jgi:hypothetical protein
LDCETCIILKLVIQRPCTLPQAFHGGRAASSVFGAEHLLRLFVRLPQLLPMTTLPPTAATVLETHLQQFVAWMGSRHKELFLPQAAYKATVVLPQPAALGSLYGASALSTATAASDPVAGLQAADRSGNASGADMNGDGSDM